MVLSVFWILTLVQGAHIVLNSNPAESKILRLLPYEAHTLILHLDEVKEAVEAYRKSLEVDGHLTVTTCNEFILQCFSLAGIIFTSAYEEAIQKDNDIDTFDYLFEKELDGFHSVPIHHHFVQWQRQAFQLKKPHVVQYLFNKFRELRKRQNLWFLANAPHFYTKSLVTDPLDSEQLSAAEKFMADYKNRPDVHAEYMHELIDAPKDFESVFKMACRLVDIRLHASKKKLEIVARQKFIDYKELRGRFKRAIQYQLHIGCIISVKHDLVKMKSGNKRDRQKAIDTLITSLVETLSDDRFLIPKPLDQLYMQGIPQFSREWMYLKFRLISLCSNRPQCITANMSKQNAEFIQMQDTLGFLIFCKLINGFLPFSSPFCVGSFPYLIQDIIADEQSMAEMRVRNCMNEGLSTYLNLGLKSDPKNKINYSKNFFETALPNAYSKCIQQCDAKVLLEPSPEQARFLGVKKPKKKPVKLVAQTKGSSIISLVPKKEILRELSESASKPIVENTQNAKESHLAMKSIGPLHLEDNDVENANDATTRSSVEVQEAIPNKSLKIFDESVCEQKKRDDLKQPVKIVPRLRAPEEASIEPMEFEIEYVDDEALEKELKEYKLELAKYNEMNDLPTSTPQEVRESGQELKVTNAPSKGKKKFVASWSTGDFLDLFPAANAVYHENIAMSTAELAASKKNLKFQWIFDESIVIDQETYMFLCQVFGLNSGSKELTFANFLKAFFALTKGDTVSKKNRTVFKFRHCFDLGDCIGIPPIGSVHPEHLSSRFNHVQVREFLEHGGAHPYFFKLIEPKK